MKNITVLGWYDKKNIGDESYKLSFPMVFKDCEFSFTDGIQKEADEYVLGGGDVLSDEFVDKIKSPCRIISASANPKLDFKKLRKFKSVLVRDKESANKMNCSYSPDLAFILNPSKYNGKRLIEQTFEEQRRDRYEKVIVIVINGYLLDNHETNFDVKRFLDFQKLAFQLSHLIDFTNASFLFVPFGQELPYDDRVANMYVLQKTKFWKKNAFIYCEPNVQNVLDIISAADLTISTRLHSTIFSIVAGTPFLDIVHNHKNKCLLDTLNLNEFSTSFFGFDEKVAMEKIQSLLSRREYYSQILSDIANEQKILLGELNDLFSV